MTALALAVGWGVLVLVAGQKLVARAGASERALDLGGVRAFGAVGTGPASARHSHRVLERLGPVGRVVHGWARHRAARRRAEQLVRELPAAIDLLAVATSAGATPFAAVATVAQWAPPTIGGSFASTLVSCRLGSSFDAALVDTARRDPSLAPLTSVLATGFRLGAAITGPLARLAAESRRDLRRRAETRARTVPVRLLFPLVFLVLPAFGLLTVVPAVASGFHGF
jgi:pilus assembly protein TadC